MRAPSIRGLVNGLGLLLAVIVAVSAPAGYFAVGLAGTSEALTFKAQLSAVRVAQYVFVHNGMLEYQHVRLAELIEFPAGSGSPVHQRITDVQGRIVLDEASGPAEPVHRFRAPIIVGGEPVA